MKPTSLNLRTKKGETRHGKISGRVMEVVEITPLEGAVAALVAATARKLLESGALVVVDGEIVPNEDPPETKPHPSAKPPQHHHNDVPDLLR